MLHNERRSGLPETTNSFSTSMSATQVHLLERPRLIGTLNETDAAAFGSLRSTVEDPSVRKVMKQKQNEVLKRQGYLIALADTAWRKRYKKPLPPIDVNSFKYEAGILNIYFKTFDYFLWRKDCFVEIETSYGIFFVGITQELAKFEAIITIPLDAFEGEQVENYRKVLNNFGYGELVEEEDQHSQRSA